MGKFGKPDHLQGATLFLISDISEFITGILIPVDEVTVLLAVFKIRIFITTLN